MPQFLSPAKLLTFLLLAQAALFYGVPRVERRIPAPALNLFPKQAGRWRMLREQPIDPEARSSLQADQYLSRDYAGAQGQLVSLFAAFFRSQRTGQTPHSPKNCLPGSGWIWTVSDTVSFRGPGRATPIEINRYIVTQGDRKAVVLYWYQSRDRVIASEFRAAAFTAWDAIRYNRTDTTLVRVLVPVVANREVDATNAGMDFVQSVFPALCHSLPN